MENKMNARKIFMEVTMSLLKKMPLTHFTVKDITSLAGLSRQSFYVYFRDKYDLTHQLYREDLNRIQTSYATNKDGFYFDLFLMGMFENYREKNAIYKNMLLYDGQDSLFDFMKADGYQYHMAHMLDTYRDKPLSPEVLFVLEYHTNSVAYNTREYILNNAKQPPKWLVASELNSLPLELKRAYDYKCL